MQIEQTTSVVLEGNPECNHAFLTKGMGNLTLKPLIKSTMLGRWKVNSRLHSIERICFNCGRLEVVDTDINWSTPFSFEAVIDRFKQQLPK